jgi:hypothetical protein
VSGKSVTPIADIYDATEMTSANTPSETLSVTPFGDPTWQRAELTTIGHQSQIFLGDRLLWGKSTMPLPIAAGRTARQARSRWVGDARLCSSSPRPEVLTTPDTASAF